MSRIRVADIIAAASRMTGIPVADITGRSRVQRLARVRQAIAYVAAKQDDRMSYPQIGRILGRDHSTILHSIGMAEIFRKRDPEYAKFLRQLRMENRRAPKAYFRGLNFLLNEQQDKAIDAFVEAVALLGFVGRSDLVDPSWVTAIRDAQQPDGGWKEEPDATTSSSHTTFLALWVLLQQDHPDAAPASWIRNP